MHSFDLLSTGFGEPCLRHLQSRFPGRIVFHKGDSTKTVPQWANEAGGIVSCDLIHVDGRHSYINVLSDFLNLLPVASRTAVVAWFDDPCDPDNCDAHRGRYVAFQPTLAVCDLLSARYIAPIVQFYEGARQFALFRLLDAAIACNRSDNRSQHHATHRSTHVEARGRGAAAHAAGGAPGPRWPSPKLPCERDAPLCVIKGPRIESVPYRQATIKDQPGMHEALCSA